MVELCGARMVPGTIDAYPNPAPAADGGSPAGAHRRSARPVDRGERGHAHPRAAGVRDDERDPRRDPHAGPAVARHGRPARGGPDRRGGSHLRPRQASHDAARASTCGGAAHTGAAAAAPSGGRASRSRPGRGGELELRCRRSPCSGCGWRTARSSCRWPIRSARTSRSCVPCCCRACSTPRVTTRLTASPSSRCSSLLTCICPEMASARPTGSPRGATPARERHHIGGPTHDGRPRHLEARAGGRRLLRRARARGGAARRGGAQRSRLSAPASPSYIPAAPVG